MWKREYIAIKWEKLCCEKALESSGVIKKKNGIKSEGKRERNEQKRKK